MSNARILLSWPQWQGAGIESYPHLAPELDPKDAPLGYVVGNAVLGSIIDTRGLKKVSVPVSVEVDTLHIEDGIYAGSILRRQLAAAVSLIAEESPSYILTLGGECSTSVAPFSYMAKKHGSDLAVIWIDAHPDVSFPEAEYSGYHAMAVTHLLGHGDSETVELLPAVVDPSRVALVSLTEWTKDEEPNIAAWGLTTFSPHDIANSAGPVVEWLKSTGATKIAIHFDVDTITSNEITLGLGKVPQGSTMKSLSRVINGLGAVAEVVAFTIAEYVPRQVIVLRHFLESLEEVPVRTFSELGEG